MAVGCVLTTRSASVTKAELVYSVVLLPASMVRGFSRLTTSPPQILINVDVGQSHLPR
jgi:hypothetical protein